MWQPNNSDTNFAVGRSNFIWSEDTKTVIEIESNGHCEKQIKNSYTPINHNGGDDDDDNDWLCIERLVTKCKYAVFFSVVQPNYEQKRNCANGLRKDKDRSKRWESVIECVVQIVHFGQTLHLSVKANIDQRKRRRTNKCTFKQTQLPVEGNNSKEAGVTNIK